MRRRHDSNRAIGRTVDEALYLWSVDCFKLIRIVDYISRLREIEVGYRVTPIRRIEPLVDLNRIRIQSKLIRGIKGTEAIKRLPT